MHGATIDISDVEHSGLESKSLGMRARRGISFASRAFGALPRDRAHSTGSVVSFLTEQEATIWQSPAREARGFGSNPDVIHMQRQPERTSQ